VNALRNYGGSRETQLSSSTSTSKVLGDVAKLGETETEEAEETEAAVA
jgi:hypothetical protein